MRGQGQRNALLGILAGMMAGALASAVMDGYWWAVVRRVAGDRPEQKPKPADDEQLKKEPATQIVADEIAKAATGQALPRESKPLAGIAVHYVTGLLWGGLYGGVAARIPRLGVVAGLIYGLLIWLALDEIAIRMLDIAPEAKSVPTKQHAQALGAHLVFGAATALITRRLLKKQADVL